MTPGKELEEILGACATCAARLSLGDAVAGLLEQIDAYSDRLEHYLRNTDITSLDPQQRILLGKINHNHAAIMDIIAAHKQQLKAQIDQVRKGQQLQHTYHGG